jgi:hypothetical protein
VIGLRFGRSGAALLGALALVSCSSGSAQAPSSTADAPSTMASASLPAATSSALVRLTAEFKSTQHGYAIKYPATWTATAATAPWVFGEDGDVPGDATTDLFRSPATAGLVVSSQALLAGMTEEDWFAAYLQDPGIHPECFPPRADWEPITIGGQPAGVHGGLAACLFTEAVAVVDGRAYVFTAYPNLEVSVRSVFDRALFDLFLSTVEFHPGDAR